MKTLTLPSVAVLSLLSAWLSGADAANLPAGHVVVARSEGDATILWDASSDVTEIVKNKVSDTDANTQLAREAVEIVAHELNMLPQARTIAVRIIYNKTGDVSPVYGTATFLGVERYAKLSLSAADARSDRDKWREKLASREALPQWIDFKITGSLPPR